MRVSASVPVFIGWEVFDRTHLRACRWSALASDTGQAETPGGGSSASIVSSCWGWGGQPGYAPGCDSHRKDCWHHVAWHTVWESLVGERARARGPCRQVGHGRVRDTGCTSVAPVSNELVVARDAEAAADRLRDPAPVPAENGPEGQDGPAARSGFALPTVRRERSCTWNGIGPRFRSQAPIEVSSRCEYRVTPAEIIRLSYYLYPEWNRISHQVSLI